MFEDGLMIFVSQIKGRLKIGFQTTFYVELQNKRQ